MKKRCAVAIFMLVISAAVTSVAVRAENESALKAEMSRLSHDWEHVKFNVTDRDEQEKQIAALAERASKMIRQYPNQVEALIWLGFIVSEQASMANENGSPIKALRLANAARDILEMAEKADPITLDAGAPTVLGVLYYRVPGFPIGFGDTAKARQYLHEAIKNAPNGLDANFFYGDFLSEQHEYEEAQKVLKYTLTVPRNRDRPIWDRFCRMAAQKLLEQIEQGVQR